MKRVLSMMILVVMLLSVAAPAMAVDRFCIGEHTWGEESITPATCTKRESVTVKCTKCSKVLTFERGRTKPHVWVVAGGADPTCTEDGVESVYCDKCGAERNNTIKALGHNYKVTSVVKEATCLEGGQEKVKCSRCGKTSTRDTGKADHAYSEWIVAVEATDSSKGQRSRACTVCGNEQSEEYYPEGTLYRGIKDEKEAVKVLQTQLTDCGYLNDTIDGIFGGKTEQAAKDFQAKAGLNVDGIAWPETLKLLEKEWLIATGAYVENCTRIENEDGTVEFLYCEGHKPLMDEIAEILAVENAEQTKVEILAGIRAMYQAEVDALFAEWLETSADEEKPNVLGAQTMFNGYLSAQETVWNKQYGENSEETLTKVNEMLHDKWVELCGFVAPAAVE